MTSSVFFKFKSQKEPQRVTFDGTGITVFELKRDIITLSGLGDGTDFDLSIYDDSGSDEYTDDTTVIPRSSSVIARRLPPSLGHGRGKASRYVTGKAPIKAISKSTIAAPTTALPDFSNAGSEADRLNAIVAAEGASWEQQQQEMAQQKRVAFKGPNNKRPLNVPEHEPPPKYVCHRCGKPGHWIQMCPTNNDPTFESKPKIKRTTGIPRSFMKKLDKPLEGEELDDALQGGTVMIDADGNHVIVNPDTATWEKAEAKLKASAAQKQEADEAGSKELQELGLECPIDKKLFENPVKTPCCGKTYCHDCIENALVDNDLTCPNCSTDAVLIDELVTDEDMVASIRKYEDDKVAEKKAREQAAAKSPPKIEVDDSNTNEVKTESKNNSPSPETKAPSPTPSSSSTSKKRVAEETLENPRSPPKAPKSMIQAQQQNVPPGFDPKFMEMMAQYAPQGADVNNQQFQNQMFDPSMMGMMGMNGMNMMGMPGMPGMPNPMINPMMIGNGMQNGFNQGMGFNNNNNNNMNGNWQQQNGGYQQQNNWPQGAGWSQRGGHGGGRGGGYGEENSAYSRGPVNPNRARGRQQRQARNNDYNTL
jgi:protein MPE1